MKKVQSKTNWHKSQIEVDQNILNFLGDIMINTPDDLVMLKNTILVTLESRPYNNETRKHANSIQWKRTASEIIQDNYVYEGKACSDIAIVFLALCKARGVNGCLVKLKSIDNKNTHSIVEVKLNDTWYRIDPSSSDSVSSEGRLTNESIWNKKFKVWRKGHDVWDLNLDSIETEENIYN
ncbi:transglutaminase domain-containing protein [Candidatus Parcubacteria bacterium]|nr:transglutaminase domain-containing protein [Candidatus Parcubacteria bacterium]